MTYKLRKSQRSQPLPSVAVVTACLLGLFFLSWLLSLFRSYDIVWTDCGHRMWVTRFDAGTIWFTICKENWLGYNGFAFRNTQPNQLSGIVFEFDLRSAVILNLQISRWCAVPFVVAPLSLDLYYLLRKRRRAYTAIAAFPIHIADKERS